MLVEGYCPAFRGCVLGSAQVETESLLDQSHKFVVLGPDEKIWYFAYEGMTNAEEKVIFHWQAYSKRPGLDIFVPDGPWSEESVFKFLEKHSRKLTDADRIDLFLFLHKGGIEIFLLKNRIEV